MVGQTCWSIWLRSLAVALMLAAILGIMSGVSNSSLAASATDAYVPLRYVYIYAAQHPEANDQGASMYKRLLQNRLSDVPVPFASSQSDEAGNIKPSAAAQPELSPNGGFYHRACWYQHEMDNLPTNGTADLDEQGGRCIPIQRLERITSSRPGMHAARVVPVTDFAETTAVDESQGQATPTIHLVIEKSSETELQATISKHAVLEFTPTSGFCTVDYELDKNDVADHGLALKVLGAVPRENDPFTYRQLIPKRGGSCSATITARSDSQTEPIFVPSDQDTNPAELKLFRYYDFAATEQLQRGKYDEPGVNILKQQSIRLTANGDNSTTAYTRMQFEVTPKSDYSVVKVKTFDKANQFRIRAKVDDKNGTLEVDNYGKGYRGNVPFVRKIFETGGSATNCTTNGSWNGVPGTSTRSGTDCQQRVDDVASGSGGGCSWSAQDCLNPTNAAPLTISGQGGAQGKQYQVLFDHVETPRPNKGTINNWFPATITVNGESFPLDFIAPCRQFRDDCSFLATRVGQRNYVEKFDEFVQKLNRPGDSGLLKTIVKQPVVGPNAGSTITVKIEKVVPSSFNKNILDRNSIPSIRSEANRGYAGQTNDAYRNSVGFNRYFSYQDNDKADQFSFSTRLSVTITNPRGVDNNVIVSYATTGNSDIRAAGARRVETVSTDGRASAKNAIDFYGRGNWQTLCGNDVPGNNCPRAYLFANDAQVAPETNAAVTGVSADSTTVGMRYRYEDGYLAKTDRNGAAILEWRTNDGLKQTTVKLNDQTTQPGQVIFNHPVEVPGAHSVFFGGRTTFSLSIGTVNNIVPLTQLKTVNVAKVHDPLPGGARQQISNAQDVALNVNIESNDAFMAPTDKSTTAKQDIVSWGLYWANSNGEIVGPAIPKAGELDVYQNIAPSDVLFLSDISGLTNNGSPVAGHDQLVFVPNINPKGPLQYRVTKWIYQPDSYLQLEQETYQFWGIPGLEAKFVEESAPTYVYQNITYDYSENLSRAFVELQDYAADGETAGVAGRAARVARSAPEVPSNFTDARSPVAIVYAGTTLSVTSRPLLPPEPDQTNVWQRIDYNTAKLQLSASQAAASSSTETTGTPLSFSGDGVDQDQTVSATKEVTTNPVAVKANQEVKLQFKDGTGVGALFEPNSIGWQCQVGAEQLTKTGDNPALEENSGQAVFTPQSGNSYSCEYTHGYSNLAVVTNSQVEGLNLASITTAVTVVNEDKTSSSERTYLVDKNNSASWTGSSANPISAAAQQNRNGLTLVKRLRPGKWLKLTPQVQSGGEGVTYTVYRYRGDQTTDALRRLNLSEPDLTDNGPWQQIGATTETERSVYTAAAVTPGSFELYLVQAKKNAGTLQISAAFDERLLGIQDQLNIFREVNDRVKKIGIGYQIQVQPVSGDSVDPKIGRLLNSSDANKYLTAHFDNQEETKLDAGTYHLRLTTNNYEGFNVSQAGWKCVVNEAEPIVLPAAKPGIPANLEAKLTVKAGDKIACEIVITTAPVAVIYDVPDSVAADDASGLSATLSNRANSKIAEYYPTRPHRPNSSLRVNATPITASDGKSISAANIRRAIPGQPASLEINFGNVTGRIFALQKYEYNFNGQLPQNLSSDKWKDILTAGVTATNGNRTTTCLLPAVAGKCQNVTDTSPVKVVARGSSRLFSPAVAYADEAVSRSGFEEGVLTVYRVSLIDPPPIKLPLTGGTATDLFIALSGIFMVLGVGAGYVHRRKQKGAIIMRT